MSDIKIKPSLQYLAHSIHDGEIVTNYYNGHDQEIFDALPNLYAISLVKKIDKKRECLCTILVKTSFGQSESDTYTIFESVLSYANIELNFIEKNMKLISTKINLDASVKPDESLFINFLVDMYIQNSIAGTA